VALQHVPEVHFPSSARMVSSSLNLMHSSLMGHTPHTHASVGTTVHTCVHGCRCEAKTHKATRISSPLTTKFRKCHLGWKELKRFQVWCSRGHT
jgi:hypothetical protein